MESNPALTITHLVSRGGQLAWDPIALGGDSVNYSTEEQWTGKLWIDGKKIYQTTVLADGLPNSTFRDYPHGILNVEEIVGVEGFFSHSGRMYPLPSVGIHPSEVSLVVSAETFTIWTYRKYTETIKVVVTLRYTCTDR